ncbi:methyltransferase [Marinomonas aquimarina]|uniref:methyltransferase n=1 Tax=Marinomonas aquimarina TaxID=295068 RepID=UPI0018D28B03|nr:methyltransferase [Marinomonas aquimarina]
MNTSKQLSCSSYTDLFKTLDHWLAQHQSLWDVPSFHALDWPWLTRFPELCDWLQALPQAPDVNQVEQALERCVAGFERLEWPWQSIAHRPLVEPDSHFSAGIKGRKWQQIQAFSQAVAPLSPVLEWCAGKGHLGKLIAYQHQVTVCSAEWQASLCQAGQKEAKQRQLPQRFIHADVLQGEGLEPLRQAQSAIALHACGDLHTTLIEQGIAAQLKYFAISPCCYHLTRDEQYQPLSQVARHAQITLTRENLKLAVKEVVTAGQREQRLKHTELVYRLGFDAWQRHVTGADRYLNVPSCNKALLGQGFVAFATWAAEQKSLSQYVAQHSFDGYQEIGQQRSEQVAKVEAICQYFRRPLELWLILDRALRLEEAGYRVTVEAFCDKALTPRNLLILAQHSG